MAWVALNFLAKATHKDINRSRRDERAFFPDSIKELIAGKNAPAMIGEIFEKAEFADGSRDVFSGHANCHGGGIDFQVSYLYKFAIGRLGLGAKNVADPRDQFARAKGFGDVTIAASVESLDAIGLLRASRKKNDGSFAEMLVLANLAAEIETADSRQHDIEQEKRRVGLSG